MYNMKKSLMTTMMLALSLTNVTAQTVDRVYEEFQSVPDSCRTKVWWFHGENITTREGITADLEAYKAQGIGGVVYYDQQHGPGTPDALMSMTPEWWDMLKFAAKECKRLGLIFEINISNGYVCGGPWITPDLGMKAVYSSNVVVKGGEHYRHRLPSTGKRNEKDIAVWAFPLRSGMYETKDCIVGKQTFRKDTAVVIYSVPEDQHPFTARSLSYYSEGFSKGAQAIVNVPCEPQEDFCGDSFTLQPDLGELEASDDGKTWRKVCNVPSVYRKHSLQRTYTISFPVTIARYFRLNLHDWDEKGKPLVISNVSLSERASIYRWEEGASYTVEYPRPSQTPKYGADEVIDLKQMVNLTSNVNNGELDWTAPAGNDWKIVRFVYAPTGARTKHGRKNLMGYECDKLSEKAAELHWNSYAQVIIDTLKEVGCRVAGVAMDSHEAGQQNWCEDMPELFKSKFGYDPLPFLLVLQGYVVGSTRQSEQFLSDMRRTISDGISDRYFGTLQRMASKAGVYLTAQAVGNGQSITSDNFMAKGRVNRPQGEFWTRMHDGSYDIKEAACAVHLYGGTVASAEAFTAYTYTHPFSYVKDEVDMATAFQVNELVVCASEFQPWVLKGKAIPSVNPLKINTGYNRDYALNRLNTMWPFSKGFWDYQGRNNYVQRQGTPIVDILVYAGDETPMKLLAHRLPIIPEGYDFDVCSTDALMNAVRFEDKQLVGRSGCPYRLLAIEKSAVVRPETERLIAEWKAKGLPVYDNRVQGDNEMQEVLDAAGIYPDMKIKKPSLGYRPCVLYAS